MKKVLLVMILALLPWTASAHEGHDKTPGAVAAPHGGVMHDLNTMFLELVVEAGSVKLYPYTHDVKPIALGEISIDGTATMPKTKKSEKVVFSPEGGAFVTKVDAKGAHRYQLDVTLTHRGKKDSAKFNVEPQ